MLNRTKDIQVSLRWAIRLSQWFIMVGISNLSVNVISTLSILKDCKYRNVWWKSSRKKLPNCYSGKFKSPFKN
jgi:hypothetical protein